MHDVWHLVGCLIDTYEHRVIYDAGLGTLVEIQSRLPNIELGKADQLVWDSKSGVF
jgi:hypothetical protein